MDFICGCCFLFRIRWFDPKVVVGANFLVVPFFRFRISNKHLIPRFNKPKAG